MARFGKSFADMAEAMLEDVYKSSHHVDDLKTSSSSSQEVNGIPVENNGRAGGFPSSALKRNCGDEDNYSGETKIVATPQDSKFLAPRSPEKRNSDSRSVIIQVPPKRQKIGGNYSASDIVHSMNRAVTQDERLEAIQNAIITFDHDNRDLHDDEIAAGADIALVKALVFLEFKAEFRREPIKADMEAISSEIGLVLKALECVYR